MRRSKGFSLIELLAAAAIIGVLATVAVPVMETVQRRGKERELRTALREMRNAIDAYKAAADIGRVAKEKDASGYPPSLAVLASGVTDLKNETGLHDTSSELLGLA
jgi:general secretion pathway protein G